MAKLLSTIENKNIDMKGSINLFSKKGNWLDGFNKASIKFFNITNTSDYNSWMSNASYADVTNFTIGTYINGIGLGGIDDNGGFNTDYMIRWLFNVKDGTFAMRGNPDYTVDYESNYYLNSNNYTKFMPTKTGSGASGTWGINISGTSKTITDILPISKGGTSTTKFFRSGQIIYSSDLNSAIKHKGFCNFQCNTQVSTYTLGFDEKDINPNGAAGFEVHNKNNNMRIWTTGDSAPYYSGVYQVSPQKALIRISTSGVVEIKNTSDRRKKIYIEDTPENEVRTLLNIPIRNFIFKEDIKYNKLEQNGIFAQDLREAMKANNIGNRPYLQWEYNDNDRDDVYYDINSPEKDDMTYSVSYNHMVPALIKGWQMQNKEIEELEKKLAILRIKKINGLSF